LRNNHRVEAVAEFLLRHPAIRSVNLEIVGSRDGSFFGAIKKLFLSFRGSLDLSLRGLAWWHVGFAVSGLKSCGPALRSVNHRFDSCGLVDEDYASFFDALATHKTLESFRLDLDGALRGRACARSLMELLRQNRALKVLEIEAVPTEAAAKAIVLSAIEGLRDKSSLCEFRIAMAGQQSPLVLPHGLLQLLLSVMRERNLDLRTFGGSGVGFPIDESIRYSAESIAFAREIQILLKQNRYGRRSVQMLMSVTDGAEEQDGTPPPQVLTCGVWPYLLGKVAADPSAVDVMYWLVKFWFSLVESAPTEEVQSLSS
jgi:hypothetical protein